MLGQIWFWFTHHHEWETVREGPIAIYLGDGTLEGGKLSKEGSYYDLRCTSCGVMKKVIL